MVTIECPCIIDVCIDDNVNAIAFDVEEAFWSHRGERCSVDTMLDEFELHTEALERLA